MKIEFLLVEYQRLQQIHFEEKKDENQRVNFFILSTSGAIAGVVLLLQNGNIGNNNFILIEALLALFIMIGFNTLGRVAMAHKTSKVIMELKKQIRKEISIYVQNKDFMNAQDAIINEAIKEPNKLLRNSTTLYYLVITVNTFLIGGFISILLVCFGKNLYCDNLITLLSILIPTVLLIWFILLKYYEILKSKLRPWESSF